jgi:hypothetical protein
MPSLYTARTTIYIRFDLASGPRSKNLKYRATTFGEEVEDPRVGEWAVA